jgi:DNA-binding beta-propeller fold protein YncE
MKSPRLILALVILAVPVLAGELEDPPAFVLTWGSFGHAPGQMAYPLGIASDTEGNVYVADFGNGRIQKFTGSGSFIRAWGRPGSATGEFRSPAGVAISVNGRVYVVEAEGRVQYFTQDGAYLGSWTCPDSLGEFHSPPAIATDIVGDVYVSDRIRILKFTADGDYILSWGSFGTGPGQFVRSEGIVTDLNQNVYVVDGSGRIQKFTTTGQFLAWWPTDGGLLHLASDQSGNIYGTDRNLNRIYKYSSAGTLLTRWGSTGIGNGQFSCPTGVAIDLQQNVFVADQTCTDTYARIQKFSNAIVPVHTQSWGTIKARYR